MSRFGAKDSTQSYINITIRHKKKHSNTIFIIYFKNPRYIPTFHTRTDLLQRYFFSKRQEAGRPGKRLRQRPKDSILLSTNPVRSPGNSSFCLITPQKQKRLPEVAVRKLPEWYSRSLTSKRRTGIEAFLLKPYQT